MTPPPTGTDAGSLQRTLALSLAHTAAFNQFAQSVLLAATVGGGEVDPDALLEPLRVLHASASAEGVGPNAELFEAAREWGGRLAGEQGWSVAGGAEAPPLAEWLEWQQALQDCSGRWQQLLKTAGNDFCLRLQQAGPEPHGLMQIYRLWVEVYEENYARALRSAGFLRDHARLLNASTVLAEYARRRRNALAARLGRPGDDELDRLVEELHQLRRQARARGGPGR